MDRWILNWPGVRFQRRFQHQAKQDEKTISVIRAGSRPLWFDQNWGIIFPLHPEPQLDHFFSAPQVVTLIEPDPMFTTIDMSEQQFQSIMDEYEPPYLLAEIYPEGSVLHQARSIFLSEGYRRGRLVQKTATYIFPELAPVQKDYISELFEFLRVSIQEDQETDFEGDPLLEGFDLDLYDPKRDVYPMPISTILDRHIRTLVLEMTADGWCLTIGYDLWVDLEAESQDPTDEITEILEIMARVDMEDGDGPEPGDKEYVITGEDGQNLVLFFLSLNLISH